MNLHKRYREHCRKMGINNTKALQEHIENIFIGCKHQNEVLISLYRLIFPDWDRIEKIQGFPEVGDELWKFVCGCFIDFDKEHHPKCMPGGAWINQGFSSDATLQPWQISFNNCSVAFAG